MNNKTAVLSTETVETTEIAETTEITETTEIAETTEALESYEAAETTEVVETGLDLQFAPSQFLKQSKFLGIGMLGIYLVMGILIIGTAVLNKVSKPKDNK